MNPTDQARKEARRRELKKNKKQRLLVRQTVLKGKDPTTIFSELEKIDQMEFNPVQSAPLSEKVLKEKRKKLRDTLNRIMRLYEKEEPTQWTQIKAMEVQYEKRRAELIIYCESVKHTQTVNLEEIPLPNLDLSGTPGSSLPAPPGILKKISSYGLLRKSPGVPSVPPPEIYDIWDEGDGATIEPGIPGIDDEEEDLPPYHTYYQFIRPPLEDIALPKDTTEDDAEMAEDYEEDDDNESDDENLEATAKPVPVPAEPPRPTTLQQRMLAIAGQDVNTVIQEMDYLHRQKEINRQVTHETRKARMEAGDFDDDPSIDNNKYPPHMPPHPGQFQRPPMMPAYGPYGSMGPPPPMGYGGFVPPPIPGSRLPPGPPPRMPQGLTPRLIRPPGMPPPPPPGLRPGAPSMLTGRPQLSTSAPSKPSSKPTASIIEAKPQMRNLSADLTRFVPTTLKVKKDMPPKKDVVKPSVNPHIEWRTPQVQVSSKSAPVAQPPVKTKDDAYSQFMKEMQGFM